MAFSKYASYEVAEVLDVKGTRTRQHSASIDKLSDYENYRTGDGYLYVRIRAISSRVNKNNDGWPSVELAGSREIFDRHHSGSGFTVEASEGNSEYGFRTFVGKPIFVDHHNSNPKKARGVIVDAKLNVLDHKTATQHDSYWGGHDIDHEHLPPTEVELLLEVDAKSFPRLAQAIVSGDLDGFSMGCDVDYSKCSHCGHTASSPEEYCAHILMKGAHHDFKTAEGKRVSRKSYENCYGIKFFEISAVFDPADETALAREVRASIHKEAEENPLPQEFMLRAPEDIDTLREEQVCPICGNDMESETCQVCGYVQPPKEFDNPDLDQATKIREEMKQQEEQASQTQPQPGSQPSGGAPPTGPNPMGGGSPTPSPAGASKAPATAKVTSEMHKWTPKLHPKTAARINQVERPVNASNPPVSNDPRNETVIKDQTKPVTSAMHNAQRLMATAQHNHYGAHMYRTADGPSPAGGSDTTEYKRVNVTDVGGVDNASNEEASRNNETTTGKPNPSGYKQIDVTGIGGTGVENVEAESTESLPTAGEKSDDSGFEKSKQIEQIPTKTFGDKDGEHSGVGDPVTSETPEWQDINWDKPSYNSNTKWAYESGPLETLDQQGGDNGGLQSQSPSQGVDPADPIGRKNTDRVDLTESVTSPDNNSGPTDTWSGTDGNGVLRQQDPVTREDQEWAQVKVPDVELTTSPVSTKEIPSGSGSSSLTSKVSLGALRLARAEVELGLVPREQEFNRVAELDREHPAKLAAQLETLARVKTAGLNRLEQHRTSSVTRVPRFNKIATGPEKVEPTPMDNESLDAGLFLR